MKKLSSFFILLIVMSAGVQANENKINATPHRIDPRVGPTREDIEAARVSPDWQHEAPERQEQDALELEPKSESLEYNHYYDDMYEYDVDVD